MLSQHTDHECLEYAVSTATHFMRMVAQHTQVLFSIIQQKQTLPVLGCSTYLSIPQNVGSRFETNEHKRENDK